METEEKRAYSWHALANQQRHQFAKHMPIVNQVYPIDYDSKGNKPLIIKPIKQKAIEMKSPFSNLIKKQDQSYGLQDLA